MADIDMIPRSYRHALAARGALLRYGAALALLLAAGAAATGALRWRVAVDAPRLEQLRRTAGRADALRTLAVSTGQRRDTLAANVNAYDALHGAGAAAALARALDGALNDKVWLDQLTLKRGYEQIGSGGSGAGGGAHTPQEGTLEVTTAGATGQQTWRLANHVEITGNALDQEALAAFLAALSTSPALAEVRFADISTEPGTEGLLAFRAVATLRAAGGAR